MRHARPGANWFFCFTKERLRHHAVVRKPSAACGLAMVKATCLRRHINAHSQYEISLIRIDENRYTEFILARVHHQPLERLSGGTHEESYFWTGGGCHSGKHRCDPVSGECEKVLPPLPLP